MALLHCPQTLMKKKGTKVWCFGLQLENSVYIIVRMSEGEDVGGHKLQVGVAEAYHLWSVLVHNVLGHVL